MDALLLIMLILRIVRVAFPFVAGIIGAILIVRWVSPQVPTSWLLLLFLFVACLLVGELSSIFSNHGRDGR